MGEIIAAAWRIFGPVVFTWSVRQLLDWWAEQGGVVPGEGRAELAGCPPLCPAYSSSMGRDDEVFFWDEPEGE